MSPKIKTPLLSWITTYFVIFSIFQVNYFKVTGFWSFASFVWKFSIICVVIFSFVFGDPFLVTVNGAVTYAGKPLIKTLDQFEASFSYFLSCIATLIYFNLNGQKITKLLDELASVGKRIKNQKIIIFIYFILTHCLFVIGYSNLFVKYLHFDRFSNQPVQSLANWLTMYIQFLTHILPLTIYNFVHYCLLKTVKNVLKHCDHLSVIQIQSKLKLYSLLNCRINSILSLPMLLFILGNTANSIVCATLLSTDDEYGIFVFVSSLFIYQFFVASLSNQTNEILQHISLRVYSSSLKKKKLLIVLKEFFCYEEHFKLKIFSLINFDKNFVILLAFFILNYGIILLQTKE